MGTLEVPSSHMTGVSFQLYTTEELLKLSVKEITNPNCLDALHNPTYGGLYDPALGPSDRDDVCGTCGQSKICCPGHMGHIRLPVPVYSPVLFSTMVQLLTGTCFGCHRIKVETNQKEILKCQYAALDHGVITLVDEMQEIYKAAAKEVETSGDSSLDIMSKVKHSLESAIKDHRGMEGVKVKNVTESRELLYKEFIGSVKKRKNCPHCGMPSRPLRTEHKARVFFQKALSKGMLAKYFMKKKQELSVAQRKRSKLRAEENADIEEEVVEMDDDNDEVEKLEVVALKAQQQEYLTPSDIRSHLSLVWDNDGDLLAKVYGSMDATFASSSCATNIFFLDVIPVPPSRFRPIASLGGMSFENPQTSNLSNVLQDTITILGILRDMKEKGGEGLITGEGSEKSQQQVNGSTPQSGRSTLELLNQAWTKMQRHVNCVLDEGLDKLSTDKHPGVKQLLEKKEGLFRMNMMGKRVNYACRSVISPDPYINTNEIGIPLVFATKLTYPEPVTPWNFQELKQAVLNGPRKHPGACFVENEDGSKAAINPTDATKREAMAKQLLTRPVGKNLAMRSKKVHRHLRNGDVLLLNRQPTLHRPSIQAHKARVLPGEKTLRLHYANCKAYNADFDGDEMNAHFPQDEISRAESYTIALTDQQYLVPKDGTPLAGLLQDHMVSGVMLTLRGRMFCRADYQQLIFGSLTDKAGQIKQLAPCILKPQQLWSGKQVLSTVLINIIPEGKPLLNLQGKAKIAPRAWISNSPRPWTAGGTPLEDNNMTESEVVICQGELLVGVLDKGHYGPTPYGLVHSCYQLYGAAVAGCLLTCLAKLFTCFLQLHGFTLGVEDILCKPKSDEARTSLVDQSTRCGPEVAQRALNMPDINDKETLQRRYEEAHFSKNDELKDMDLAMKGKTDEFQNAIAKVIIPGGLLKGFPSNNLQLMVQSGAKGSSVNCMQISCLLGQIELEGRRPSLMMSGKALPSFAQYDMTPRAGGFVAGRFLTGIRPQEYFFHCMAGREGLVDTAVKTSRSGYLQRCIIKHLEGLMVNYDQTVRDSDGSIVQFQYGEDGLDIPKTQFLNRTQVPFLVNNKNAVVTPQEYDIILSKSDQDAAPELWEKVKRWRQEHGKEAGAGTRSSPFLRFCQKKWTDVKQTFSNIEMTKGRSTASSMICRMWQDLEDKKKRKYVKLEPRCPDPVLSQVNPASNLGGVSESFEQFIDSYLQENPDQIIHQEDGDEGERKISGDGLRRLLYICNIRAQVQPGEAVGLLAAQSIGEPSTQMTLNTFHFAGRGEMNVTLGIPRLREILVVASANLKTPNMDVPLLATDTAAKKAKSLKQKLNMVYLSEVLEDVTIVDKVTVETERFSGRFRSYAIRFNVLPHEMYKEDFFLDPSRILHYMETKFFSQLTAALKKKLSALQKTNLLHTAKVLVRQTQAEGQKKDTAEDVSDDDQHDGDATATKQRNRQMEDLDYDGEEEEKEAVEEDDEEDDEEEEDSEDLIGDFMKDSSGSSDEGRGDDETSSQPLTWTSEKKRKRKEKRNKMSSRRVNSVLGTVPGAISYEYDADEELWCEITLQYALSDKRLDMTSLVETETKKAIVYQVPGISRCFLVDPKGDDRVARIKVEGINLKEMYKYSEILDLNNLYTNDIHTIANVYGIEAAARAVIKEIRDVFAAYGIEVDYRHLSLVADYMTFEGSYKAFNRNAIASHPSPFQKMSFETTMNFLKSATLAGVQDDLSSPSSRIIVGRTVQVGTGCFDLLQPLT